MSISTVLDRRSVEARDRPGPRWRADRNRRHAETAPADPPTFVKIEVNRTFVSPSFSAFCGFEIDITQVGVLKATVFNDAKGTRIVREIGAPTGFKGSAVDPVTAIAALCAALAP